MWQISSWMCFVQKRFSAAHLLRTFLNCSIIFDFFENHFFTEESPGTNLSHSIVPPPCKLLCISDHNSLIYSIFCKFFILVPICYKRLQQPLFFIFKNFPHISQLKPWYKIQHPWTLNIFKRFSKRFCSKDAAIYSKKKFFLSSTIKFWILHAKIPPYTNFHAFFKICSEILLRTGTTTR